MFEYCKNVGIGQPKQYDGSWVQMMNDAGYSVAGELGVPHLTEPHQLTWRCMFVSSLTVLYTETPPPALVHDFASPLEPPRTCLAGP